MLQPTRHHRTITSLPVHSVKRKSAFNGNADNPLWWTKLPGLYCESERPTPEPQTFEALHVGRAGDRRMPIAALVAGHFPAYHPSVWRPTTVAVGVSHNPYYVVLGGSYSNPVGAVYTREVRARTFALHLERWRLFGGSLCGGHTVLFPVGDAIRFAAQCQEPRLNSQRVNVQTYTQMDRLEFYAPADIIVPRNSLRKALKFVGEVFEVVPHAKAVQLGRHNFVGDVALDVALCLQWSNMRQCDRERFLTPNELAEWRLWRNIPKRLKPPKQLLYSADAPHYHA